MIVAVIGLGRVGLPLSLFIESLGLVVVGIDRDPVLLDSLARKVMPFHEKGCQDLLERTQIAFTSDYSTSSDTDYVIITVGTPLRQNIETDLSLVHKVIHDLLPFLHAGQTVILRSTVAPETTAYLKKYIELHSSLRIGMDIGLAFCPERLAENNALHELRLLPQIIGCEDELSRQGAARLFEAFGVKLMFTNHLSAELVKLFNNASRYVDFAVANYFAIIANDYRQNIYELIAMANEDYPRGHIYGPGFTAGTCLRKDFGMINERRPGTDMLLSAWKINEYMPFHLVDILTRCTSLYAKKVVILGFTFKKNSDDMRDTLASKLIHYIEQKVPSSIVVAEPHVSDEVLEGYPNQSLEECLPSADVIFISVNHDCFTDAGRIFGLAKEGAWIVDLWNCLKKDKTILQVTK